MNSQEIKERKTTPFHADLADLNPEYIQIEDGAFKESGTMVNTVLVIINK